MSYYRQGPFRGSGGHGAAIGVPPLTPMVRKIMIACGAVWAVQFVMALARGGGPGASFGFLEATFGLIPVAKLSLVWQPFTYMWLHAPLQIFHLGLNLLMLWMVGGDLERHWGSRAFLRYYLVCGIGAGGFIALGGLASGGASIPTVGASGAVYGLLLAFGMIFGERVVLFMFIFPMKARTLVLILFVVAFVSSLGNQGGGVSHIAHLGGVVVGYLYLKRAWRVVEFARELRWKMRRRSFRVIPPKDDDPWVN